MNKLTKEVIEAMIAETHYINAGEMYVSDALMTTTFCTIVLKNGYSVHGHSACVDPANYNKDIGEQLAYAYAFRKLWPILGYAMRCNLMEGANNDFSPVMKPKKELPDFVVRKQEELATLSDNIEKLRTMLNDEERMKQVREDMVPLLKAQFNGMIVYEDSVKLQIEKLVEAYS